MFDADKLTKVSILSEPKDSKDQISGGLEIGEIGDRDSKLQYTKDIPCIIRSKNSFTSTINL
jgi:hypothetical protein